MPEVTPSRGHSHPRRHRGLALAGFFTLLAWKALRGRPRPIPIRQQAGGAHQNPATAYEPTDWDIGPVALVYAGLLALLVICCFVLIAAYPTSLPDADRSLRSAAPGQRLQTNPGADLQQFRADEQKRLDTYYWVDKQKGIVHIPIEQAMKKIADTGIAGFPKGQE